ncbi:MAG TPA: hypothetical protein VKA34_03665 [Balneolales bacterium]|nr:hypothetical protein [Balneolales bacterium]
MKKHEQRKFYSGLLWWKPEQWERAKEICIDGDDFEPDYQEWKKMAERKLIELHQQGINIVKVEIDLDEFINWCNENGKSTDGNARTEFVALKVKEQHESN